MGSGGFEMADMEAAHVTPVTEACGTSNLNVNGGSCEFFISWDVHCSPITPWDL